MTLLEFIEARLTEDEATAIAAAEALRCGCHSLNPDDLHSWTAGDYASGVDLAGGLHPVVSGTGDWAEDAIPKPVNIHIARHDPARVLREVEAKRRIARQCAAMDPDMTFVTDNALGFGPGDHTELAAQVLALLALPYADHPDYDPSWSPT